MSKEFVDGKGKKLYLGYETDEIVANPELDGTEVPLTSLKLGDDKYKLLGSEDLKSKADLTNENQTITADKIVVNEINKGSSKTTYTNNIIKNIVEDPNDETCYAHSHLAKDFIELYFQKNSGLINSRVQITNRTANFYVKTLEEKTQYMPKRVSNSLVGISEYPYMTYEYYEDNTRIANALFSLNYNGFRVTFNDNELKLDRFTNKLTYNNNEIIDKGNIDNQFLTDSEMNTLLQEVFEQEVVVDEPTVR